MTHRGEGYTPGLEGLLITSTAHGRETGLKWIALGIALALHTSVLLIDFPDARPAPTPPRTHRVITVRKYVPPPPKNAGRRVVRTETRTRRMPVPDPSPGELEPIREAALELEGFRHAPGVEVLIGVPAPPAAAVPTGPVPAGVGGATVPSRIEASYVKPEYPEVARLARVEGDVVLQAVILRNGTVGEIRVLRCNHPNVGFEDAAITAVRQWRYRPATQDGRPVDVYFSILVEFALL